MNRLSLINTIIITFVICFLSFINNERNNERHEEIKTELQSIKSIDSTMIQRAVENNQKFYGTYLLWKKEDVCSCVKSLHDKHNLKSCKK